MMIDELSLARSLHVLGVVMWIGGVSFVTTTLLPSVRRFKDVEDQVSFFETVEHRFAWQARLTTLLTGGTGFYLCYKLDLWHRFTSPNYWWMHAMVLVWVLFSFVLFVAEPLFLHAWFSKTAVEKPKQTFQLIHRMHVILLTISLITTLGAMMGAHGGLIF